MGSLLEDGGGALTAIILAALGAVLLLGALGALVARRVRSDDAPAETRGRQSRLVVSEAAIVDARRRLVLVRRDNVEHLLLIGGPSDIVVETNIVRQRAPALGPGPRPAGLRQSEVHAMSPAAAAGAASPFRPERVRLVAPEAAAQERARPGQTEGAAPQERLRSASAALALRQAAVQPGQAGDDEIKRNAPESPAHASPAVAGLAAGLAALTAAAGSRSRSETRQEGAGHAKRPGPPPAGAGLCPPEPEEQVLPTEAEPDQPSGSHESNETVQAAGSGEAGAGPQDEPARVVFGVREVPQPPSERRAESDSAPRAADEALSGKAGDRGSGASSAMLGRRSVEADFAFLERDDEERSESDTFPAQAPSPAGGRDGNLRAPPAEDRDPEAKPAWGASEPVSRFSDQNEAGSPAARAGGQDLGPQRDSPGQPEDVPLRPGVEPTDPPQDVARPESESVASAEAERPEVKARFDPNAHQGRSAEPSLKTEDQAPVSLAPVPPVGEPGQTGSPPSAAAEQRQSQTEPASPADEAGPHSPPGPAMDKHTEAVASPVSSMAPLSGFRPGRGTTLGDLAGRLDEVLIQQAASGADADGGGLPAPAKAVPSSPAVPPVDIDARDKSSGLADPETLPVLRSLPTAAANSTPEKDEAAIIDFAARRKTESDSLEEEMARLLGELTRDTNRRG